MPATEPTRRLRLLALILGPALALTAYWWVPDTPAPLSPAGRATLAVAAWMACWWVTEALPLAATALLPIALFPLLGVAPVAEATAPYANSIIYLFLGGFILGLAIQRWGLHRRMALVTLAWVGTRPRRLVAGFMLSTALLSMWISNTAAVILMMPIALSVVQMYGEPAAAGGREASGTGEPPGRSPLATSLMLGIAYAASIGGMGTLIGTPPNLVLASFLEQQFAVEITMLDWMRVGLPVVAVLLPATWWYLVRIAYPVHFQASQAGRALIQDEIDRLGPLSRGEKRVLWVFALTATGWILRPQLVAWTGLTGLSDTVIAVSAALILFVLPVDLRRGVFAMDWQTAKQLPWGILLLFGGGLSLASAIAANGVDVWIGSLLTGLKDVPPLLAVAAITALVVFLTEITSNTAVTTTLLPVFAATALAADLPAGALLTATALSASCAFMLPVATPPNAIVFSSGHVEAGQMARTGLWLNLLAIVLITLAVQLLGNHLVLTGADG